MLPLDWYLQNERSLNFSSLCNSFLTISEVTLHIPSSTEARTASLTSSSGSGVECSLAVPALSTASMFPCVFLANCYFLPLVLRLEAWATGTGVRTRCSLPGRLGCDSCDLARDVTGCLALPICFLECVGLRISSSVSSVTTSLILDYQCSQAV